MIKFFARYIAIVAIGLITVIFLSNLEAAEIDCSKHKIYCQIKKNRSDLSYQYAMKLSNIIYKATKKHSIPSNIYTAILMQESRYELRVNGCHKGLIVNPDVSKEIQKCLNNFKPDPDATCLDSVHYYVETKICSDFGMSQIYYKTAEGFGFNILKLTNSMEYSVEAGAIVLADFKKRYSKKEKTWWTRYNASSKDKRKIYKTLVKRYL